MDKLSQKHRVCTRLTVEQHRMMKAHAARQGLSIEALLARAIDRIIAEDLGAQQAAA